MLKDFIKAKSNPRFILGSIVTLGMNTLGAIGLGLMLIKIGEEIEELKLKNL